MAVEKWKMENGDLGVKVVAPRVLLPFHFRPSVLIAYIYCAEFHTTFDNTLSCTSNSYQLGMIHRPILGHLIYIYIYILMSRTL